MSGPVLQTTETDRVGLLKGVSFRNTDVAGCSFYTIPVREERVMSPLPFEGLSFDGNFHDPRPSVPGTLHPSRITGTSPHTGRGSLATNVLARQARREVPLRLGLRPGPQGLPTSATVVVAPEIPPLTGSDGRYGPTATQHRETRLVLHARNPADANGPKSLSRTL